MILNEIFELNTFIGSARQFQKYSTTDRLGLKKKVGGTAGSEFLAR